jgi:hypothetical protein
LSDRGESRQFTHPTEEPFKCDAMLI